MINYDKIIESTNLIDFVVQNGYKIDPKGSRKIENGYVYAEVYNEEEKLLILRHKQTKNWIYFNRGNDNDKGNIISFLKNRNYSFEQINEKFKIYVPGEEITNEIHLTKKEKINWSERILPIQNYDYLKSRLIVNYNHPTLLNRIYTDKYNNTVFPLYNERLEIIGYEGKNFKNNGFEGTISALGSDKENGFWLNEFNPNVKFAIIGEAPIDVLSYCIINKIDLNEVILIATCGSFSIHKFNSILNLIKKYTNKIELVFDNDKAGYSNDFKIIKHQYQITIENTGDKLIIQSSNNTIEINKSKSILIETLNQLLLNFNPINITIHKPILKDYNLDLYRLKNLS